MLKPLDIVVATRAATLPDPAWTVAQMAAHIGVDDAQVHRAAKGAVRARLLVQEPGKNRAAYRPNRHALKEFLIHGVKYMIPPVTGRLSKGLPTAHAAPILESRIGQTDDAPPVWPYAEGTARGESVEPIHKSVPFAAHHDPVFYAIMALVDALRIGRARERNLAAKLIPELIDGDRR